MRRLLSAFILVIIGTSLLGAPVLIYLKPHRFIAISVTGLLIICFTLFLKCRIAKNKFRFILLWIPTIYILFVFMNLGLFYFKNDNINLPEPLQFLANIIYKNFFCIKK